jgi:hypothetical protein
MPIPDLTALRRVLADLYPREADQRRLAVDAGLRESAIAFDPAAETSWFNVLQHAKKQGRVDALVALAREEYPQHEALSSILGGAPAHGHAAQPKEAPPVAAPAAPPAASAPPHAMPPRTAFSFPEPVEVFYSCAVGDAEDAALLGKLEDQLRVLERRGVLRGWSSRRVGAGKEWRGQVDAHLERADIVLLLVSASFLGSDDLWDEEMKRAMARHERGEARVIPVILRPCLWDGAPFGSLAALPEGGAPVTDAKAWPSVDAALLDVAKGIEEAAREVAARKRETAGQA